MKRRIQNTKQIRINKGRGGAGERCNSNIRSIIQHLSVRIGVQNHEYGKYPIGPKYLPRFLWANEEINKNNLVEGFTRNHLIIKVFLITVSPAVDTDRY
jgi:hypothetical protein